MVFEPVSAANKKDWVYRGPDADGLAAGTVGLPKSRWERKGYTMAPQELPKGYLRDTQGLPKGTTRSHHRSNAGATPNQRRGSSELPKPPNACSEVGVRSGRPHLDTATSRRLSLSSFGGEGWGEEAVTPESTRLRLPSRLCPFPRPSPRASLAERGRSSRWQYQDARGAVWLARFSLLGVALAGHCSCLGS